MVKCECCKSKKATVKDYRYIEGVFSGKCFMCSNCFDLSDVEVYKIINQRLKESKPDYQQAYQILMEIWDSISDEEKPEVSKRLKKVGC